MIKAVLAAITSLFRVRKTAVTYTFRIRVNRDTVKYASN